MEPPDQCIRRFIDVDGVSIHALRWPRRGAPPLLLLHATGFLADIWRRVVEGLGAHYDVAALDLRGHGRSDRPDGAYDFPTLAGDVAGALDALGWRDVYAVGHSTGGGLALIVAARRPELVRRVFGVEPIVPTPSRRPAGPTRKKRGSLADGGALTARRLPQPGGRRGALARSAAVRDLGSPGVSGLCRAWTRRAGRRQRRAALPAAGRGAGLRLGGGLRCRALPARCPLPGDARAGAAHRPRVRRHAHARRPPLLADAARLTIPGASHLAPMEFPALVADEIRAFDAAVTPGDTAEPIARPRAHA